MALALSLQLLASSELIRLSVFSMSFVSVFLNGTMVYLLKV